VTVLGTVGEVVAVYAVDPTGIVRVASARIESAAGSVVVVM
jgi:hypothetical protein